MNCSFWCMLLFSRSKLTASTAWRQAWLWCCCWWWCWCHWRGRARRVTRRSVPVWSASVCCSSRASVTWPIAVTAPAVRTVTAVWNASTPTAAPVSVRRFSSPYSVLTGYQGRNSVYPNLSVRRFTFLPLSLLIGDRKGIHRVEVSHQQCPKVLLWKANGKNRQTVKRWVNWQTFNGSFARAWEKSCSSASTDPVIL